MIDWGSMLEWLVFIWLFILSCFCIFGIVFLAAILGLVGKVKELTDEGKQVFTTTRDLYDE